MRLPCQVLGSVKCVKLRHKLNDSPIVIICILMNYRSEMKHCQTETVYKLLHF